jgi:hypothetical protein
MRSYARWRVEGEAVAERVRQAPDVETALRWLAACHTREMWKRWLAAAAFDEVPLAGLGLRRHEVDGAVVWVGPAVAIGVALGRARARGLVLQVDQANGGARVYRVSGELELVATLIVDESPAPPRALAGPASPPLASQGPSALLLFAGCTTYGISFAAAPALALCGLAVAVWVATEVRRSAQRRARALAPPHRATLTVAGASPYRDGAVAAVPVEQLFAWFRAAGVPIAARHGDAYVTAGAGDACRIDGAGVGAVRVAELRIAYDDPEGPATVANVLAPHVGAVQVAFADGAFTIARDDDFARWLAEHRRVRARLADLADALDVAIRA